MMTNGKTLSVSELKALTYFAVGVSSEGSLGGRDVSNRLSLCGRMTGGKMYPIKKSGLSIGTLQKDMGQDGKATASALVQAYQAWATTSPERSRFTDRERDALVLDLSRDGDAIRAQKNRGIDSTTKDRLNEFLRADEGKDFVHQRDLAQVEHVYAGSLAKLVTTPAYDGASIGDRIKMATIVAKAFNQNEVVGRRILRHMDAGRPDEDRLDSLAELHAYTDRHFSKEMKEGRDAALVGAEVYSTLRGVSADNPLHEAWAVVEEDPLIAPSKVNLDDRPDFPGQYATIKNLFLEPARAEHFIEALEQGHDYSYGRAQAVEKHAPTSGFFVSDAALVQWNKDGQGAAYIDGAWARVSRDDIIQTKNADGSVDLAVNRNGKPAPLLHVEPATPLPTRSEDLRALREGMRGENVRGLQADLIRLKLTDASGRPLTADGDFGAGTRFAVMAFQRNHNLTEDGVVGPATLAAIHEFAGSQGQSIGQGDAPYLGGHQPHGAMSAYGSLTPEPETTVPLAPVPAKPSEPVAPAWLQAFDEADGHAIRTLQQNLNTLGILDMKGESLAESGIYDVATQTAVARFQSQQSLPVTGTADDDTLASIQGQAFVAELQQSDRALTFREPPGVAETWRPMAELPAQTRPKEPEVAHLTRPEDSVLVPPRLDHPAHPDHEFFREVRKHVVELDRSLGRGPDHYTDNISSALTVQARADGLERVDRIELSERGDVLRAVQMPSGNSGSQFGIRTQVATVEAETPLEQSAAKWPDAMRAFEGIEQARAERRQQSLGREQSSHVAISDGFGAPDRQAYSLNDPRNPDSRHHALYKELERRLPESSDERLMQFTAACHRHRIKANDLSGIHVDYDNMTLSLDSVGFMATPATVDLSLPPPESEQSLQQMRQFDQQMEQIMQQSQQHAQAVQQGPAM
jgi:peptidoglycan hydrolase-like protein with peptidoglycan-binding domain